MRSWIIESDNFQQKKYGNGNETEGKEEGESFFFFVYIGGWDPERGFHCQAYEDALLELKTEVENRGFHVIGAGAFPTEHSIVRSIGLSRPNKADLKTISEFGIALNRRIKNEDLSALSIQVPGNTPYRKYAKTPLIPKADVSLCTECKACVKSCPAGAISAQDPKKTDKKKCISCLRCVRSCKQKARSVSSMKLSMAAKKLNKVCQSDKAADIFL